MDAQAIDPKLIRSISTTKKLLGKHISKPVLVDKYLGRPPFRFLLEIVNNVILQTNFMKDVFAAKELKYEEVSSAEDKRAVLKKVIEAIENETGEKCTARTSKILSGKEPEKTNEMLQLLAKAISSFSSKSKRKVREGEGKKVVTVEKSVIPAVVDDDDTLNDGNESKSKEAASPPPAKLDNDDNIKREVSDKEEGDPNKKEKEAGKSSSTAVPVVSKKSSTTTTNATASSIAKRKSSGGGAGEKATVSVKSKSSLAKTSVSASSTKVPSKETLKGKAGSPSNSSSTLTLAPPKKVSNTSIPKSSSRQSLSSVKSTSSANKEKVSTELGTTHGKEHQEENLQKSLSKDKLQQKSGDVTSKVALPPEKPTDIPLQRPVTRTKYRQKTSEAEDATDADGNEVCKDIQENDQEKDAPMSTATTPGEMMAEDDNAHVLKNDKKECGGCGLRSGRSSSSEDVMTEHMNLKISEWRAGSAETNKQQQREPEMIPTKKGNKTGWIAEEKHMQSQDTPRACQDSRVFQRPITVLRDNESGDEEDETFLVQEKIECERDLTVERQNVQMTGPATRSLLSSVTLDITYLPPEQRGLLVNQIMETQRELEKLSSGQLHYQHHHQHGMENELAERDKAAVREVYLKQIEDLKEAIQKMSKCELPLANIIQRSQDDSCLMEIEFRKLKQENERLQREIDEAKGETSRILYPLTEELTQLDTRIEKVEGAIVLAKQRLALIDSEYAAEFIAQLENTPTVDEVNEMTFAGETDPILQFRGNFPPHDDDDEVDNEERGKTRSLMDVFKRAVNMHEGLPWADNGSGDGKSIANPAVPTKQLIASSSVTPKCERRLLNRTVYGDYSPLGRRTGRILHQLEKEEPLVDKENKPSWWD